MMNRKSQAFQLRLQGWTYQAIGHALGVSRQFIQQMTAPPKAIREAVIQKAGGQCEKCHVTVGNSGHVHHNSKNVRLEETYNDLKRLQLLCVSCHRKAHHIVHGKRASMAFASLLRQAERRYGSPEHLAAALEISTRTLMRWKRRPPVQRDMWRVYLQTLLKQAVGEGEP